MEADLPDRRRAEKDGAEEVEHGTVEHNTLSTQQRDDPGLKDLIWYLETGELPGESKRARELVLGKSRFTLCDKVLYKI